ncbi:MAG: hypothetical protein GY851_06370, partial [bacterium]|nr:hypothetical protein [bacterium]
MAAPMAALVRRELLVTLRKYWAFAGVALTIGVVSALAWEGWPKGATLPLDAGQYARQLLGTLAFTLYGAVILFIPGLGASAIAGERVQDTYEQVSLTLLRPGGLVYGKLLNTLGFFALLVAAVAPAAALVFMLVGVDWLQFLVVFAVVAGTAISTGAIGIAASARARHPVQANILTYALVILLQAGGAFLAVWTLTYLVNRSAGNEMAAAQPFFVPYVLLLRAYQGNVAFLQCLGAFMFQLSFAGFCVYYAIRRIQRVDAEDQQPVSRRSRSRHGRRARRRTTDAVMQPIGDVTNPVYAKDVHVSRSMSKWLTRRKLVAILVLLVLIEVASIVQTGEGEGSVFFCLLAQSALVILIVPAVAAATMTGEFQPGTLDALRLTLLSGDEIIGGKVRALFRRGRRTAAAFVVLGAPLIVSLVVLRHGWDTLITGYSYMAVGAVLAGVLALLGASMTRRIGAGQVIAYGLCALLWFGAPFLNGWVAMLATDSGGITSSPDWAGRIAVLPSPLLAFMANFDKFSDNHRPLFTGY